MSLLDDQDYALKQYDKIILTFPTRLLKKEDEIARRLTSARTSFLNKVKSLYEVTDELMGQVGNHTPCKKGCSGCCFYKVNISTLEANYIEANTKFNRSKTILAPNVLHGSPCPFLVKNSCSIYKFRPYACRRHHALTPNSNWCLPDISLDHKFARVEFSELNKAYSNLVLESKSQTYDIRELFERQTQSL